MSATDELEHYMTACSGLRAENARLQTALDETHGRGVWLWSQLQATATAIVQLTIDGIHFLERERDGYKALAERRGKALGKWLSLREHLFKCRLCLEAPAMCHEGARLEHEAVSESESTIDATPEAREKEGR